jgi:uncharacterized protein (DUF1778 family)
MPRTAVENDRMAFRLRPEDKATILRAAAIADTDLTSFVVEHALAAARTVIEEAEVVRLTARDSLRVLDYLENPPAPNERLKSAARALRR